MIRIAAIAVLLALPFAARAQQPPAPPPGPVTLSAQEFDAIIQQLAEAPAKWSYIALQILLSKRQPPPAAQPPAQPKAH